MTRIFDSADSTTRSDSSRDTINSVWNTQLTPNDYLELGQNQTLDATAVIDEQGITFGSPYGDSTFDSIPGYEQITVMPESAPEEISVMPEQAPEQITVMPEPAPEELSVMPEPAPEQLTVMPNSVPEGQSAAPGRPNSEKEQTRSVTPSTSWWIPEDLAEHARSTATGGKEGDTRASRSMQALPWGLEILSPRRLAQVIRDVAYAADRERSNPQLIHASGTSTAPSDVHAVPKPAPAPRRQK